MIQTLMVKEIVESEGYDNSLNLIGTIIHHQIGTDAGDGNCNLFKVRLPPPCEGPPWPWSAYLRYRNWVFCDSPRLPLPHAQHCAVGSRAACTRHQSRVWCAYKVYPTYPWRSLLVHTARWRAGLVRSAQRSVTLSCPFPAWSTRSVHGSSGSTTRTRAAKRSGSVGHKLRNTACKPRASRASTTGGATRGAVHVPVSSGVRCPALSHIVPDTRGRCAAWHRRYSCILPLKLKAVFTPFPFQVFRASVQIEMASTTVTPKTRDHENQQQYRLNPTLLFHKKEERNTVFVRDAGKGTLNGTSKYELVTEAPSVTVHYEGDTKGERCVCQKYDVCFYMMEPYIFKLISTMMPVTLVVVLATYNVLAEDADLENSIAIALTIVFLLPNLKPTPMTGAEKSKFTRNEMMILCIFFGLIFTSYPSVMREFWISDDVGDPPEADQGEITEKNNGTLQFDLLTNVLGRPEYSAKNAQDIIGTVGLGFLLVSLLIPVYSFYQYKRFIWKIRDRGRTPVIGADQQPTGDKRLLFCQGNTESTRRDKKRLCPADQEGHADDQSEESGPRPGPEYSRCRYWAPCVCAALRVERGTLGGQRSAS